MKDTARNAVETGSFVVHITDESIIQRVNETAANLPPDESEVEKAGFTPIASEVIAVPGLQEAKIRTECFLEQSIPLGGSGKDGDLRLVICSLEEWCDSISMRKFSRMGTSIQISLTR